MTSTVRATLLVNLAARGVARRFDPERAARYLRQRGLETEVITPSSAAGMTAAAAAAAGAGQRLVFVAGGDGTLRDAARGLAGTSTALAPVPAGTVNVFAREIGLPAGVRAAIDAHLAGQRVRMDLGRANGEPFLLMASAGWDARVVREVSLGLKRRAGDLAYILKALQLAPAMRPVTARWVIDGDGREAPLAVMIVSNTTIYGRLRLTPDAVATDGVLDLLAFCPHSRGEALGMLLAVARRRAHEHRHVVAGRTRNVVIETPGLAYQLDGDYAGETPVSIGVDPGALVVSVPPGPLAPALRGAVRVA